MGTPHSTAVHADFRSCKLSRSSGNGAWERHAWQLTAHWISYANPQIFAFEFAALCQRSSCHPTTREFDFLFPEINTKSRKISMPLHIVRMSRRSVTNNGAPLWMLWEMLGVAPTITRTPLRLLCLRETLGGKRVRVLPDTWWCAAVHPAVATMRSCLVLVYTCNFLCAKLCAFCSSV
jgi:hypothetical protein